MQLSEEFAAQELLRRQRARSSLVAYSQAIEIPGVPNAEFDGDEAEITEIDGVPVEGKLINRYEETPVTYEPVNVAEAIHHILMMEAIQRCIETPRGRTIIMAPPGSAKSTKALTGASWAMGRKCNTQVIIGSYGTSIACKQSRKVRSICRSQFYSGLWPRRPLLMDDQRAIDDWSLSNGSSLMAAGLLAGVTGNRCDLFILDDVVQNREQADSATIREKTWSEYTDTVLTRAKPWMSVLAIGTRWHEEDLIGMILPEFYEGESGLIRCRDGQLWEVLCLTAECERLDDPCGRKIGEFLWPEYWPRSHWSSWRDDPRAARTWAALYQQRPAPFMGIHFSREQLQWYDPWKAPSDADVELLM